MEATTNRFKGAPWLSLHPEILIGGAGGIGSNTSYCLARSVDATIILVDDDDVCEHNVGTQFFSKKDIMKKKVNCVYTNIKFFNAPGRIVPIPTKIDDESYRPITIAAFDNMEARKQLFNVWKKREDRELFIDGRMRATLYEIYCVTPGREEDYEKTLFSDSEADEGTCTFKQTSHFGMLIGARITQVVTNYLSNKGLGADVYCVPFKVKEVGDLVYMEVV